MFVAFVMQQFLIPKMYVFVYVQKVVGLPTFTYDGKHLCDYNGHLNLRGRTILAKTSISFIYLYKMHFKNKIHTDLPETSPSSWVFVTSFISENKFVDQLSLKV